MAGVFGAPLARKPNCADAPAAREPFHDRLRTVTVGELETSSPFQSWVIDWPEPGDQVTVQPVIAAPPALTVTMPWKPPCQELAVWYVAEQPPGAGGVVVGAVVGGVLGAVVGGVVGGVVGAVVGAVVGGVVGAVVGGFGAELARL